MKNKEKKSNGLPVLVRAKSQERITSPLFANSISQFLYFLEQQQERKMYI